MATILIVSGSYYPYATANAVCVKKFEDVLRRNGHNVLYCNRKHDLYEPERHLYEGTELYTVGKNSDIFYQTMSRLSQLDMPNKMGLCFRIAYSFFRVLMKLMNISKSSSTIRNIAAEHYINTYAERISELVIGKKVDVIISVSMPFDSHKAVLKAQQFFADKCTDRKPHWIIYCIDAYWSKAGVKPSDIPQMKVEEREVFGQCDTILLLDTIKKDFSTNEYDFCQRKIKYLPLPLFDLSDVPQYSDGIERLHGMQNWLFAGTIYDDYSNIEALAFILRGMKGNHVVAHIMGKIYPKSLSILEQLQSDMPGQIVLYGRQPYEFAKGSMQRADVLINLANDNANQIPSKIFEYMSCLKPILNIYKLKADVGTEYMRKYPLAFNFYTEDFDNQFKSLLQWLQAVHGRSTTFDELREIYHDVLSETVSENFYALVKPNLGQAE